DGPLAGSRAARQSAVGRPASVASGKREVRRGSQQEESAGGAHLGGCRVGGVQGTRGRRGGGVPWLDRGGGIQRPSAPGWRRQRRRPPPHAVRRERDRQCPRTASRGAPPRRRRYR